MRPDNRNNKDTRTLGDLIDLKMELVAVCRRCKHRTVLFPVRFIARYGRDFLAIELRALLRCSQCRARGIANLHETWR